MEEQLGEGRMREIFGGLGACRREREGTTQKKRQQAGRKEKTGPGIGLTRTIPSKKVTGRGRGGEGLGDQQANDGGLGNGVTTDQGKLNFGENNAGDVVG